MVLTDLQSAVLDPLHRPCHCFHPCSRALPCITLVVIPIASAISPRRPCTLAIAITSNVPNLPIMPPMHKFVGVVQQVVPYKYLVPSARVSGVWVFSQKGGCCMS